MTAFFIKLGLKMLGFGQGVAGWWRSLSPKARKWLLIALAVIVAVFIHEHYRAKHDAKLIRDAKREQLAADQAIYDAHRAAAVRHKQQVETKDVRSAEKARNDYAKDVFDLGAAYDELRRRPPSRVQPDGRGQGSLPGLAGDPVGAPATAQGTDAGLLEGLEPYVVASWPELLEHGESCDVDRARMKRLQDLVIEIYANHGQPIGGNNGK